MARIEIKAMSRYRLLVVAFGALLAPPARGAEPFVLKDGDRVVLLGNTLVEREQRYGWWELALTRRFPGVTFRNLGWSGDTVWGEARAGFGSQADGFKHLKEHVLAEKPTVIVIAYGGNEAFGGPDGLERFRAGYNALLDALAPANARLLLLSPPRQEDVGRPLPDPAAHNKDLLAYRDVIRDIAVKHHAAFGDLYEAFGDGTKQRLTDNGVHLTGRGYALSAPLLEDALGHRPVKWRVEVAEDGRTFVTSGAKVDEAGQKRLRFRVTDEMLPLPESERVLRVQGLPVGRHTLSIDGKAVVTAAAKEWADGVRLDHGPEFDQAEKLRATIVEKNRLYFHRWRPQNETYLFGFRKHEQGKNAVEIPQFDPLVAEKDAEIAKLRVPAPHVYEIKPE
jgi:lysophospholipase L1-like esterase